MRCLPSYLGLLCRDFWKRNTTSKKVPRDSKATISWTFEVCGFFFLQYTLDQRQMGWGGLILLRVVLFSAPHFFSPWCNMWLILYWCPLWHMLKDRWGRKRHHHHHCNTLYISNWLPVIFHFGFFFFLAKDFLNKTK